MKPHMVYSLFRERVVVMLHDERPPTKKEWDAFIEDVRSWRDRVDRMLILSEGGAPTSAQRAQVRECVPPKPSYRQALVTKSALARAVASMLSWFYPGIRSVRPDKLTDAFDYLELEAELRRDLVVEIDRLRRKLRQRVPTSNAS